MRRVAQTSFDSRLPERRVAITAMSCVSPIGPDFGHLRLGRSGVRNVDLFEVAACRGKTAGQVAEDLLTEVPAKLRRSSRAVRLLGAALEQLPSEARGLQPDLLIFGSTSGGMDFGEAYFRKWLSGRGEPRERRKLTSEYLPEASLVKAGSPFGLEAPMRIISNACASGTNALGEAFLLIRAGLADRILCGGFDPLSEFVFRGFDALQALTPDKCRPFDRARTGLVLGEGAAVFLMEPLENALRENRQPLAEIVGYGCSSDNFHLTQPNPDGSGPKRAMSQALAMANLDRADYINAHGTGTPHNDASEAAAISALCPDTAVSSTKPLTGHALGAAGAIEAAFCIMALREGFLPPNLHLETPDSQLKFVTTARPAPGLRTVLSNSFGFGGSNASIVLQRFP